ncbi:serine/threonine-protein kinase [Nocardioides sp. 503]|uniref:serine/threonine-protein kinase n=1 Tax=Nocardioides sp. 503 TaxID=2508326 RepID=UPI00142FA9BE|nr:serine/threonine-protein kinase [Nocardioides sp. 503]
MSLPERLGRLSRVRRLGAGGFATVWLYRDEELRSYVAVKALADNWAQRHDVHARFLEEARILRAADSDHVVRVHDIGDHDGTPYFVMTYADRGSLDEVLEEGVPLPPGTVLMLVDQAAAGLAVLHDRGVVHRDVKPQNLLLRGPGAPDPDAPPPTRADLLDSRVLVADLGVAKALVNASGLTQVVGTPAYMAPEQALGEGLDVRADVYSLGAVAYQALTGRLPRDHGFDSRDGGPPPALPSALAPLPRAVDEVLLRAVHRQPEERWPDVLSFAAALRSAVDDPAASSASPPTTTALRPAQAVVSGRSATPAATPERSGMSPLLVVLLVLAVLAATFGASFAAVTLLR